MRVNRWDNAGHWRAGPISFLTGASPAFFRAELGHPDPWLFRRHSTPSPDPGRLLGILPQISAGSPHLPHVFAQMLCPLPPQVHIHPLFPFPGTYCHPMGWMSVYCYQFSSLEWERCKGRLWSALFTPAEPRTVPGTQRAFKKYLRERGKAEGWVEAWATGAPKTQSTSISEGRADRGHVRAGP